ncbi:TMEM14 family protein [Egbenema bharatensis]|uniref:TMEM14 family protein n=1 Tax=Egbenema bharatensis TaxID=3463334 RepID=UPI003A8477F8
MGIRALAAIIYGILSLVGGIIGYAQARSLPSLVAGIISGVLLIIGAIAHQQGAAWGLTLAIVVTIALVITFAVRFWKTRKFMPAGFMCLAGIVALIAMFFA